MAGDERLRAQCRRCATSANSRCAAASSTSGAGRRGALRLDFFGDTLETIRPFDPATPAHHRPAHALDLVPASEVALTAETISRFRRNYIDAFGAPSRDDPLYAAVSEGRRFAGMEHWLPFFYERLETLFDYLPDAPVVFDHLADEALAERHALILDHYEARRERGEGRSARRRALQADRRRVALSLADEVGARYADQPAIELTPFASRRRTAARRSIMRRRAPGAASPRSAPPATSTSSTRSSSTSPRWDGRPQGRARLLERGLARPPGPDARRPRPAER